MVQSSNLPGRLLGDIKVTLGLSKDKGDYQLNSCLSANHNIKYYAGNLQIQTDLPNPLLPAPLPRRSQSTPHLDTMAIQ